LNKKPITPEDELQDALDEMAWDIVKHLIMNRSCKLMTYYRNNRGRKEMIVDHRRFFTQMIAVLLSLQLLVSCVSIRQTEEPVWIPKPTPTLSPDSIDNLVLEAGQLCESAFSSSLSNGSPDPQVILLLNIEYKDSEWVSRQGYLLNALYQTNLASEVSTLVCVKEKRFQVGTYTGGVKAYQKIWEVRLVSWPEGIVFREESFTGSKPPLTTTGTEPRYGQHPTYELRDWLASVFSDTEPED
jgi:hypothetical protein